MDQPPCKRGRDLLRDPGLNKGTAFSLKERQALGLEGLLPPQVESLQVQVRLQRCWEAFGVLQGNLERFAYVDGLRRSNLVLFHRFLSDHLEAVLPIVYTPTRPDSASGRSIARACCWREWPTSILRQPPWRAIRRRCATGRGTAWGGSIC